MLNSFSLTVVRGTGRILMVQGYGYAAYFDIGILIVVRKLHRTKSVFTEIAVNTTRRN